MAGARLSGTKPLVVAALILVAVAVRVAMAQSAQSGSLSGKLTDLHSAPLEGATVVLRNQTTGAEARTTTARNGSYRFIELSAGEYTLVAESPQQGHGRLDGILVTAGHEARLQTAMEFEPPSPKSILEALRNAALRNAAPRDLEPTVLPVRDAALAPEPLRMLALRGRPVDVIDAMPAAESPVMTATLAAESVRLPALTGSGSPASEVTSGILRAAMQFAGPASMPAPAEKSAIDPVTPAVTTTVTASELQALPVSGRRWQEFVLDTPTGAAGSGVQDSASPSGSGRPPAETTLDGSSKRLAFSGQGGAEENGMGRSRAGGRGFALSEAAIREVETAAGNVEAAGARAAGGRMNVATQSGANGLHGQGFLFDRQNTWGARNPFTQWVKNTGTAAAPVFTAVPYTPPDRETVWGVGIGSQIRRDKLFWFGALDGYRRNDPGLATVRNYTQFFNPPTATNNPEIVVLSGRLEESANKAFTDYLGALEQLGNLLGPAPRTASQWVGFGRIDWKAAERHRFTLEGIGARWHSPGGGLTRVSETYGSHSFGSSNASEEWLLGRWEAFITPNLLAVTQGSAGRTILSAGPETPTAYEQAFLSPSVWGRLPQIVVDNRYGFTIGNPSRFGAGSYPDELLYHGQEMVDWVHGGLLFKAGFDLSHNADTTTLLRNQTGTYSYSNVQNFISDALVFQNPSLWHDSNGQHGCDQTGRAWPNAAGAPPAMGPLPCYSYYSQTIGPADWHLSTNDWAGYATAQWQAGKLLAVSAGLRWEREQLPPPIAALANTQLPLTAKLPSLGNNWGPRLSLALGSAESHWPVLRLGYGMYFGRTENATLETALTQTGSAKGDMNFFLRPTDDLPNYGGGAPPFPYVLNGEPGAMVKPGAVEFAPNFHNAEIHQGIVALEERLPSHVQLTASAVVSLGRRLPISIDTNLDPPASQQTLTYAVKDATGAGPIKSSQITVPFYASWPASGGSCPYYQPASSAVAGRPCPDYQPITNIMSRANSTYEAAMVKVDRYSRRGLSLHAHYTYSHAMDWNPNESTLVSGNDVLDPAHFSQEYGTSNLDVRHSAAADLIWEAPWKWRNLAGRMGNGWRLSGIWHYRSGLPYTMRTGGSLAGEVERTINGSVLIQALGPGMNGSGGDNRVYGLGGDGRVYNIGRNTYRYPSTWKADLRLGKRFELGHARQLELLAESFNLFNHQNVTQLETTGYSIERGASPGELPTLNFLTGLKANTTAFGQPLNINGTNFYRERQIQIGLRVRF